MLVEMGQGNDTVQDLVLYLYESYHRDCKCLESLGNLRALQVLTICRDDGEGAYMYDPEETDDILFWQALAGALGRVQHNIELRLRGNRWLDITFTNFAVAMQGVSNIRTFHSCRDVVTWESAAIFLSTLACWPSLENVTLGSFDSAAKPPPSGELRGLTNLLKLPSLRSVEFNMFRFTSDVSRAMLTAFEEGWFVTNIRLIHCYMGEDIEDDLYDYDADQNDDDDQAGTIRALVRVL
jgi:hypothetical protein